MADYPFTIGVTSDPEELDRIRRRRERYDLNDQVFRERRREVFTEHRGKVIIIAGQELHVADNPDDAWQWARRYHPEDDGVLVRIVPKEKGWRIYGTTRRMV